MTTTSTWRLRDVAEAVGMSAPALRRTFEVGALKLGGDDKKATGSGSSVGLCLNRAYQAAIMHHLHRLGLSIPMAARSAYEFSNVGNVGRAPGELFKSGTTTLVIGQDATTVKNTYSDTPLADMLVSSPCAIHLQINPIIDNVNSKLIAKKAS